MWTPRTTPLKEGEQPWRWDVQSVYQCTWFAYYRAVSVLSAPCWWDRETRQGSYANAKEWLKNYRDPWVVKDADYTPVAGDIAVFDGEYGHVQFMETDTMYSEYSSGDPNSFRNGKFTKKSNLLGFLHYPYEEISPIERDTSVNQIECTDNTLRIRNKPSLDGEIVGHVQIGFYNVLNESKNDGYTWYEISKDRWCANITVNYLPSSDTDFIRQLEKFLNDTKAKINTLESENKNMREDYKQIKNIAERWL